MTTRSLDNTSQLLIRNIKKLTGSQLLLLNMPCDELASTLLTLSITKHITGLTQDYDVYQKLNHWHTNKNLSLQFHSHQINPIQSFDCIIIFLQKSKILMELLLNLAASLLQETGSIFLVGENSTGIKSWKKPLASKFINSTVIDNARHCVLFQANQPIKKETIQLTSYYKKHLVQFQKNSIPIYSLPGVFSYGKLDKGTQELLHTFNTVPSGNILDFGCGSGVISACLHSIKPDNTFTLIDISAMALKSANKTLSNINPQQLKIIANNDITDLKEKYNLIVSNPPFHQGKKTSYIVTEHFLSEAHQMLKKNGELRIVANSFLHYQSFIQNSFGNCQILSTSNGFTVYQAIKTSKKHTF